MAKTTVDTFISEFKSEVDYDITDSDLDTLLLRFINKSLKRIGNLLKDNGYTQDVTASSSFKTTDSVAYVDITKAAITGDLTTFTGTTNDKIKVSIDGTDYDNIDVSSSTDIDDVVTAINTATSGSQASANGGGYLVITSATTGSSSSVTIADGSSTGQTVVAELFSVAGERTQSAITDLDEIIQLSQREDDRIIRVIPYADLIAYQPDPTSDEQSVPDFAARFNNYIYFANTPSTAILIYIDYIKQIVDVAAGGTMPFDDKYDPLISAMIRLNWERWSDNTNAVAITDAKAEVKELTDELIVKAARNIGMNQQTKRRFQEPEYLGPKMVV